jgi:hypothetical protein
MSCTLIGMSVRIALTFIIRAEIISAGIVAFNLNGRKEVKNDAA